VGLQKKNVSKLHGSKGSFVSFLHWRSKWLETDCRVVGQGGVLKLGGRLRKKVGSGGF